MSQKDLGRRLGFGTAVSAAILLAGVGTADADQKGSRSAPKAASAIGGKTEFSLPVRYSDLDLSIASNGRVLLARIKTAAREVCERAVPQTQLKPERVPDCANEIVQGLVRQLDIATLTLAWRGDQFAEPPRTADLTQ